MKTQEQLQKMTSQELTFELACLVFGDDSVYMANFGKVSVSTNVDVGYASINDWSWLMPLAVENKLCLISPHSTTKVWSARHTDGGGLWSVSDVKSVDASPQRAIAICLILKLQEIQE